MTAAHRLSARSDVGRRREHNEDTFRCDTALGLYIVADGMGGHAAGEVASAMASQRVAAEVERGRSMIDALARQDPGVRPDDVKLMLANAVRAANAEVWSAAQANSARRGMGTTLTAMLVVGRRCFVAHVGDSRAYLIRGVEVRRLTEDHSVVNELRRRGKLTQEALSKVAHKNAITRAVGVFENVEVDTFHILAAPGDRFVLCSDGLHRYLDTDDALRPLLEGVTEEAATQRLIDYANECGGADNITAVVVTLPDEDTRQRVVAELTRSYATLSALPFFRHLEPREILVLQAAAKVRDVEPGLEVVREGEPGEAMFLIVQGRCVVKKGEMEIARLGPGEHFGEMALVELAPRSATVVAEDDTRLLEIARADFFRVLRESSDTAVKMLWNIVSVLAARLRETSSQLGEAREQLVADDLTAQLFDEYPGVVGRDTMPAIPAVTGMPRGGTFPR